MATIFAGPGDLPQAIEQVLASEFVAVDTEFHAERRYLPHLLLVQLQPRGGDTWILDPLDPELLDAIKPALLDRTWIVHAGQQDLKLLHRALGALPELILDTQIAAGLLHTRYPASFQSLVHDHLGIEIPKSQTLSDWSRRPLTEGQLLYAAQDVQLLLPLWDALASDLDARGRSASCRAACLEARAVAVQAADPYAQWRPILAVPHLSGPELAVLQELAAWREIHAREQNLPTRSVLSDGLLVDLARRRPITLGEMKQNRRFPKSVVKRLGETITDLILKVLGRPPESWPQAIPAYSNEARLASWLLEVGKALGEERGFAQRLVLPKERIEDLVLAGRGDETVRGALGDWRDGLVGEVVRGAISGEVSLAVCAGQVRLMPSSPEA